MNLDRPALLIIKGLLDKEITQLVTFQQDGEIDSKFEQNWKDLLENLKQIRQQIEDELTSPL